MVRQFFVNRRILTLASTHTRVIYYRYKVPCTLYIYGTTKIKINKEKKKEQIREYVIYKLYIQYIHMTMSIKASVSTIYIYILEPANNFIRLPCLV